MMQKIFVDTNIVLDVLMRRVPFYKHAARLFEQADRKTLKLHISTLSFITIHHLLLKEHGKRIARNTVIYLKELITLLPVDDEMIDKALSSDFDDLEDAVQYHCAISAGIDILITRNTKDYDKAKIHVMTADAFLRD